MSLAGGMLSSNAQAKNNQGEGAVGATASSNAAFGYNFEGALQEYVVLDERVIIDPDTGERFLIPVSDGPSASAVALIEPWACVEAAYAWGERSTLKAGGRLLVVVAAGRWPGWTPC